jgi:ribosomal protein S27AE
MKKEGRCAQCGNGVFFHLNRARFEYSSPGGRWTPPTNYSCSVEAWVCQRCGHTEFVVPGHQRKTLQEHAQKNQGVVVVDSGQGEPHS